MGDVGCQRRRRRLPAGDGRPAPIVGLWHSGGARLAEGVLSLHAVGRIFHVMTQASGKIPQISVVLGPAAGGAAYGPALTDVVILGPEGRIFVTGPDVVRSVTGEDVDMLRLGRPRAARPALRRRPHPHRDRGRGARPGPRRRRPARRPGQPRGRRGRGPRPRRRCCRSPRSARTTCTRSSRRSSTRARPRSCTTRWAPNIVTALGRFGGRTVGVVANNPLRLGGCLDSLVRREGVALRADVRRVRRAADRRRRRTRLPARRRPGVGRRRTPRRQAAARLRRVRGPPGHAGDPQDLRRRLHRDERPLARRHEGVRVAGRRGGGDGRRGGDPDPAPAASWPRSPPTSGRRSRPSWPPSTSGSPAASTRRSRSAWSTRSSNPPRTRTAIARAIDDAVQLVGVRRGAHGNIPL